MAWPTANAAPVSLFSGSPDKVRAIAAQIGIPSECVHRHDDWDRIAIDETIAAMPAAHPGL